jgi:ribonuclease PH
MMMLVRQRVIRRVPLECPVAAVSVGILREQLLLDLCYAEDYEADVDFNVVMTANGGLVELQGATEARPFTRPKVEQVLSLAARGLEPVFRAQREALRRV